VPHDREFDFALALWLQPASALVDDRLRIRISEVVDLGHVENPGLPIDDGRRLSLKMRSRQEYLWLCASEKASRTQKRILGARVEGDTLVRRGRKLCSSTPACDRECDQADADERRALIMDPPERAIQTRSTDLDEGL
jgi:hypothetical protein